MLYQLLKSNRRDTAMPCPNPRAGHGIAVSLQMLVYYLKVLRLIKFI